MDVEEFYRFLTARIDEDQARAVRDIEPRYRHIRAGLLHETLEERALAEVLLKRAILEEHRAAQDGGCERCAVWSGPSGDADPTPWPCRTGLLVASVYSSHPDYRPEWAPTPEEGA